MTSLSPKSPSWHTFDVKNDHTDIVFTSRGPLSSSPVRSPGTAIVTTQRLVTDEQLAEMFKKHLQENKDDSSLRDLMLLYLTNYKMTAIPVARKIVYKADVYLSTTRSSSTFWQDCTPPQLPTFAAVVAASLTHNKHDVFPSPQRSLTPSSSSSSTTTRPSTPTTASVPDKSMYLRANALGPESNPTAIRVYIHRNVYGRWCIKSVHLEYQIPSHPLTYSDALIEFNYRAGLGLTTIQNSPVACRAHLTALAYKMGLSERKPNDFGYFGLITADAPCYMKSRHVVEAKTMWLYCKARYDIDPLAACAVDEMFSCS